MKEGLRQYMAADPEDSGSATLLNTYFMSQCSNIPSKPQKRAVGPTSPTPQLVEVDFSIFNNRSMEEGSREDEKASHLSGCYPPGFG